jgi:hypothetical protein
MGRSSQEKAIADELTNAAATLVILPGSSKFRVISPADRSDQPSQFIAASLKTHSFPLHGLGWFLSLNVALDIGQLAFISG